MPNYIDLNELLSRIPIATTGKSGVWEIPAGQEVKTESSPGGGEIVFGTVPPGKKWLLSFTVHIEEVDE